MKDTTVSLAEVASLPHRYMQSVYGDDCAICGDSDSPLHSMDERGANAKLTHDLIKTATEKHIADTFNNAPSRDERNYEAEYAKEVMLHAVTKFELKEARKNIKQLRSYQANYEHATQLDREKATMPSCQPLPDKGPK